MSNTISTTSVKGLKFRIYPNPEQEILINKTFGCCRQIYNNRLEEKIDFYINIILPVKDKVNPKEKIELYKTFKPTTEKEMKVKFPYMLEVSDRALQSARQNCEKAFTNFYKSKNGSRKGKSGFPKYKSKKENCQSYQELSNLNHLDFNSKTIKIAKLGKVKFFERQLPKWWKVVEKLGTTTITKSASGGYYCTLTCHLKHDWLEETPKNRKESIGLDFTMKDSQFYTDSEGNTAKEEYGYIPQKQNNHKKLRRLQRSLMRRQKVQDSNSPRKVNSSNREKARIKLAKFEEKIANKRMNWIELESLRLVKSYDKVVVEDLNLAEMKKRVRNAKNIQDASWSTFVNKLEQKGKVYDCQVIKADRFFPSSQLCSNCDFKNIEVRDLKIRSWTCPNCGANHNRDVNAAINLRNYIPTQHRESTTMERSRYVRKLAQQALLSATGLVEVVTVQGDLTDTTPKSL